MIGAGALTLADKVRLVTGADAWHTSGLEEHGVPVLRLSDGPAGVRGPVAGVPATCFPCGTALGATWDPELVEEVGAALGDEARARGVHVLLAPSINIVRHPLAGRNFESPSEDPHLASRYAVAYVRGVQSRGVAATAKHFVANDSEIDRTTMSSEVGDRALREIYLPPFEAAVTEGGVWLVMSSYNRLNGTYTSEHRALLLELLKEAWGFDGVVVSDWWGTYDTRRPAAAGLDLEMPGPGRWWGARLHGAVESGAVDEGILDDKVRRLRVLAGRVGAGGVAADRVAAAGVGADRVGAAGANGAADHSALNRRAAAAAMVLLHDDGRLLPLDPSSLRRVALIGPHAKALCQGGGGSAALTPSVRHSLPQLLAARLGDDIQVRVEQGCRIDRKLPPLCGSSSLGDGSLRDVSVDHFANADLAGEPVHSSRQPDFRFRWIDPPAPTLPPRFSIRATATFVPAVSGTFELSLVCHGRSRLYLDGELLVDDWTDPQPGEWFYGQGTAEVIATADLAAGERHGLVLEYQAPEQARAFGVDVGCRLVPPQDELDRAVAAAAGADLAIMVVGTDQDWEHEGTDRAGFGLPGDQDELVRAVARAQPRTVVVVNAGAPVALPWAREAGALLDIWFPGQEGEAGLVDVLTGDAEPGGRLPVSFPHRLADSAADLTYPGEAGAMEYGEGVFVGYRGYERRGVEVAFPFGHGLGYTSFEYEAATLDRERIDPDDDVVATVRLRNTGARRGAEVVQVYVRDVASSLLRPPKQLAAFARVELDPGECREVAVPIRPRAFAAWHPGAGAWTIEAGEFEVLVGSSSAAIHARLPLVSDQDWTLGPAQPPGTWLGRGNRPAQAPGADRAIGW